MKRIVLVSMQSATEHYYSMQVQDFVSHKEASSMTLLNNEDALLKVNYKKPAR